VTQDAKVEVLLPVRAPCPWLKDTLIGLQEQTLEDFSLRVMMHGHEHEAARLVSQYFPDSSIQVVEPTISFSELLNLGLLSGDSQYVARIDSDDIPMRTRLEKQLQILDADPNIDLVATSISLINESGIPFGERKLSEDSQKVMRKLRWRNVIPHPSVMYRRSTIVELGGYREAAKHAEDYDLWLRLLDRENFFVIQEPLTKYRIHASQISRTKILDSICIESIAESRNSFAIRRNESRFASASRQLIWRLPQVIRARSRLRS
jgi:glycosyltransferase involved in cell wall biosynthesis